MWFEAIYWSNLWITTSLTSHMTTWSTVYYELQLISSWLSNKTAKYHVIKKAIHLHDGKNLNDLAWITQQLLHCLTNYKRNCSFKFYRNVWDKGITDILQVSVVSANKSIVSCNSSQSQSETQASSSTTNSRSHQALAVLRVFTFPYPASEYLHTNYKVSLKRKH